MTDLVLIEGLEVETVIGVYDWEREIEQCLLVDLAMIWDNSRPAASDAVAVALDYGAVSEFVQHYAAQNQPALLETLAEGLAAGLLAEFGIPGLRLTIRKPGAVAAARSVGVTIERGQWS